VENASNKHSADARRGPRIVNQTLTRIADYFLWWGRACSACG